MSLQEEQIGYEELSTPAILPESEAAEPLDAPAEEQLPELDTGLCLASAESLGELPITPELWTLIQKRVGVLVSYAPYLSNRLALGLHVDAPESARDALVQRASLDAAIIRVAAPLGRNEPLAAILAASGHRPDALFGMAIYATAVERLQLLATNQKKQLIEEAATLRSRSEQARDLASRIEKLEATANAAGRELRAVESDLVKAFWAAYEQAAVLLVTGRLQGEQVDHVRAFLRYGLMGGAPWFVSDDRAAQLRADVLGACTFLDTELTATHVLYADEYLDLVAHGQITPAIDEDLELHQRGSLRWRQDKAWRRQIAGGIRTRALRQTMAELQGDVDRLNAEIEAAEQGMAKMSGGGPVAAEKREAIRNAVQEKRVTIARRLRAIERLRDKLLPEEEQRLQASEEKLKEAGGALGPEELVRHEVGQVRRVTTLCARLKETFLPFTLRSDHRPEGGTVNTRQAVLAELQAIEASDPTIFKETVVHASKAPLRTYIRYSPYVLLAPGSGFMSYSWNPRDGTEVGRLVLPAYSQRPWMLQGLLQTLCADFRWDTSRSSAGRDLLTSDTLVAAYSRVRWDYRHRSRECRQNAAIYTEESDRKNWRRHYVQHLSSAHDGGRKLFFKCPPIYEAVVKYIGLPDGVERLRK